MEYRIRKNVDLIINHINNKMLLKALKSNITKTENEIEFEFRDKYNTYRTDEFKHLLDKYCKNNNITYEMHEHREDTAYFIIKLN